MSMTVKNVGIVRKVCIWVFYCIDTPQVSSYACGCLFMIGGLSKMKKISRLLCSVLIIQSLMCGCMDISSYESDVSNKSEDTEPFFTTVVTTTEKAKIQVPAAAQDCVGCDYRKIEEQFLNAGFSNIEFEEIKTTKYMEKLFEGYVWAVCINNGNDCYHFSGTEKFNPDSTVLIKYLVIVDDESEIEIDSKYYEYMQQTEAAKEEEPVVNQNYNVRNENNNNNNHVDVPSKEDNIEGGVWVPVNGGTKYHSKKSCSQMVDPVQISKDDAISRGYEACGRCH